MRLIDADQFKAKLLNFMNIKAPTPSDTDCILDGVINLLEEQPTIDPVKHGHWIYVGAHNGVHLFECSLCHCGLNTENPDWLSKYCSRCGAKMDGDKNETN